MGLRWLSHFAAGLAALVLAAAAPLAPVHRIVAVGDLHGDFSAWRDVARAAGLVDVSGRWSGGATVLVQTGDIVDRGPDSLKLVDELMRLQREAPKAGGRVVTLVGNHEAMNLTGDLRYVSAGDFAAFTDRSSAALRDRTYALNKAAIEAAYRKRDPQLTNEGIHTAWVAATPLGQLEHDAAWAPDGRIGRWLVVQPAVALIDGTLFVHGGIGPAYAARTIVDINAAVAAALKARATEDTAIINDPAGPLWYRGLVGRTSEDKVAPPPIAGQLDVLLPAFGAQRIVIGHTPNLAGIVIGQGGRLVRIDTGISSAFGGTPSYLEIIDGKLVPHAVARSGPVTKETK